MVCVANTCHIVRVYDVSVYSWQCNENDKWNIYSFLYCFYCCNCCFLYHFTLFLVLLLYWCKNLLCLSTWIFIVLLNIQMCKTIKKVVKSNLSISRLKMENMLYCVAFNFRNLFRNKTLTFRVR